MIDNNAHVEEHVKIGGLLKEAVFGLNDGIVSTFAVIAGLTGGLVEQKTVLLAALATLFAGAFSMGLGTYIGSKSEKEMYENERKREIYEMENLPDVERQEIRDIYIAKGFKGELLEKVVNQIVSDKEVWLKTMMVEELGFADEPPVPWANGLTMSAAFTVGSGLATIPYFFNWPETLIFGVPMIFAAALAFSGIGLLLAGGFKTRFTGKNVFLSAFETLLIGAFAAGGSYMIGVMIA